MKKKLLAGLTAVFALTMSPVQSASDYLLEIDGIKGESQDDVHKDTIEIYSFSWGATNAGVFGSGGGGGAGKVSFQDLHCVMPMSVASPQLLVACATGKVIPHATLYVRQPGTQRDYMVVRFENVLVSASAGGSRSGDDMPTEAVSFNFATVKVMYFNADGTATTASAEETTEE